MWLNDYGLDIRCVRMHPYSSDGAILVDVQTVIPIPEVADYQVRIREKKQKERASRKLARDFTKYDLHINGETFPGQSKRWMMFHVISGVLRNGGTPEQVMEAIPWRRNQLFEVLDGNLSPEQAYAQIMKTDSGGAVPRSKRFFLGTDETFQFNGKTYALTNQWGKASLDAVEALSKMFPKLQISVEPAD